MTSKYYKVLFYGSSHVDFGDIVEILAQGTGKNLRTGEVFSGIHSLENIEYWQPVEKPVVTPVVYINKSRFELLDI